VPYYVETGIEIVVVFCTAVQTVAVLELGLGGSWGPWFWVGGIQSEQLQVSYYEAYYASLWF